MKSRNIIQTLGMLICIALANQTQAQVETSLGFKAGVQWNHFNGSSTSQTKWKTGSQAGGFVNIGLANVLQFQIELLHSRALADFTTDNPYQSQLTYFEVPLFLKLRLPLFENAYPYLLFGQSAGYKISERSEEMMTDAEVELFKPIGLNALTGIGLDYESRNVIFMIDARYNHGLTNISSMDWTLKNQGIFFTGGIGFKLSR